MQGLKHKPLKLTSILNNLFIKS